MGLRIAQQAALLGAELTGLAVEKLVVDPTVQLVQVHGIDPILKTPVFALELGDGFVMELLLIRVAFAQGRRYPCQYLVAE